MAIRDENYIQISGWMVSKLKLKGNPLLAFAIIYGFSQDGESEFTGSVNYLCEWLNVSRPTISSALNELVEKQLIFKTQIERNRVIFNTYKVNLPLIKKLCGGSKETLQGSKESLQGGSKETLPNNTNLDNTKRNTTDNTNKKSADALPSIDAASLKTEFDILWTLYPRKEGKSTAERDYIKARKDKKNPVTFEEVKQGIERYIAYIKAEKMERRFIKQGSTWFHQRCWEDEYSKGGEEDAGYAGHNGTDSAGKARVGANYL